MGILKKFLLSFMLLMSFSVYSAESPYEALNSCDAVVNAGVELAKKDSSNLDSSTTLQDFVTCNLEMLPKSLSSEIIYAMFGNAMITPLGSVNYLIDSIYTNNSKIDVGFDELELKSYLENKIRTFPVLSAVIEGLTFASFQLISSMLGLFAIYYLINTMSEGTFLGKNVNTFWTFTKISIVLSLIFPLNGLGLNTAQLILLFFAFVGSFLASLIWSILPLFKYVYLTEFTSVDDALKSSKDLQNLQIAENMVTANICDMSARQALLLTQYQPEDYTKDVLSSNDMYSCLMSNSGTTSQFNSLPYEFEKTASCSSIKGIEHSVDCGKMIFGDRVNDTFKSKALNEINPVARQVAKKIMSSNCVKNEKLEKGDPANYFKYCSDIDNITFGKEYKNKEIINQLSGEEYDSSSYKDDLLKIKSMLDAGLEENLSTSIIEDEDMSKVIKEKITYALNKGWFNAGTFIFDVGSTTNIKNQQYEAIMLGISYQFPEHNNEVFLNEIQTSSYDSNYSGSSYADALKNRYENYVAKGDIRAINSREDMINIYTMNEELEKIGLQNQYQEISKEIPALEDELKKEDEDNYGFVTKFLFPTLLLGKEFNEPELGKEESCTKDYDNCVKMPINPVMSIIDTSRKSAANTGAVLAFTKGAGFLIDVTSNIAEKKARNDPSSTRHSSAGMLYARTAGYALSFVTLFLSANMIIMILAGYILPIVLFIYFLGNAISWIISIILSMTFVSLWLGLHLIPSNDPSFAGHAKKGYLLVMDILLKPVFIVLGVFGAFVLSTILLVVLSVTFEIVLSTFSFFDAPKSPIELFYNFLINVIYVIFLIIIFFKSAKAVYKIPNELQNWIGVLTYEDAGMWKEVTGLIERTFLSGVKKFLIFA